MSDFLVFLRRFFSNPTRVGSVAPSSKFLCRLMMKNVPWVSAKTIVELGPGTGVFTEAILRLKRPETNFFVVEQDPRFQQMLKERFPGILIQSEAVHLASYVKEMNLQPADAIISGLPFAVFPVEVRTKILDNVVETLDPEGVFVTFQYSLQMKAELEERFKKVSISFTPFNVPPAFVYTCRLQE
ncbi:class I SAM-dependent methyltransferase [Brevibacillus sp. B_LB10_24]|uniref:class I SAM-dependent methyltransferase n=1 Tax=Brevibacillus sp. B_LB10_24 TaxID=3380645 RepID=UPI0038BCECD2